VCEASYKTLSTRHGEAFTKQDSKLVYSCFPAKGGPHGLGQHIALGQPEQLDGRFVIREVAAGPDDLAQLHVQALDGICNRHDIAGAPRSRAAQFWRMV
jgi:hypothetical protein